MLPKLILIQNHFNKVNSNFNIMKSKIDKEILNTMSKDPGNWKGLFYYNKKDPRLLVPKFYPSMGWTFNFASPYAYITLLGIILISIVFAYFIR
jgi:uncharacterized membrane protein